MTYLTLFITVSAWLVQQATSGPVYPLFQPLHHEPLAIPVIRHDGFLGDTHEVASARAAHLAALAAHGHHGHPGPRQEYRVRHQEYPVAVQYQGHPVQHHELPVQHHEHPVQHHEHPVQHHEHPVQHHEYPVQHHEYPVQHQELPVHQVLLKEHPHHEHLVHPQEPVQKYHGPIALPVLLHTGHLADTPEVALAKSHHLAAIAQAKADKYYSGHQEYNYGGSYGYSGSYHGYGIPVVLPNGHIADTHEVAAAKSAHLLAVAKAKADEYYAGHGEGYGYGGAYGYSTSYKGYGIPVVLPSGHLADTHEVAAAKAAHLAAVAHAKAEQAHDEHHEHHEHHEHQEHHEHATHHQAHPTVLSYGHTGHHSLLYHPQSFANVWLVQ